MLVVVEPTTGRPTPELSGAAENINYEAKCTTRVRLSAGLGLGAEKGGRGCMAFALGPFCHPAQ